METRSKKRKFIELNDDKTIKQNIQLKVKRINHSLDMSLEFDDNFFINASIEWRKNKIKQNNCTFKYKCEYIYMDNHQCVQPVYNWSVNYCKKHIKK